MLNTLLSSRQMPAATNTLPQPCRTWQQHSMQLTKHIIDAIAKAPNQAISFAHFMQLALYAPGLGYYVAGKTMIGDQGDFITAPELSPLFAYSLAKQVMQLLSLLNTASILEFGAGNGTLAAQLLTTLEAKHALPETYFILETSPHLATQQQRTIQAHCPHLLNRVTWLKTLPETPLSVIIIANEVLDAMPIHLVHYDNHCLSEYYVTQHDDTLTWQLGEPSTAQLTDHWHSIATDMQQPYTSEINLFALAWLNSVSQCLAQGAILLIDYGFPQHEYYHPDRSQGTLMCHYQHQAHSDPLRLVGLQDITAHVDFTALAKQAKTLALDVAGFTNQAAFLLNCDLIDALTQRQASCQSPAEKIQLNQQVQRLTSPHEMGELFKVMALTRHIDSTLIGFEKYDQRHRL